MGEGSKNALVNIDGQAVTKAVEESSRGVGGLFKAWQIKRVARAEAEAFLTRVDAEIAADERKQEALHRMIERETRFQANIDAIADRARLQLAAGADPEKVEPDWTVNFFEKCRTVSDSQMQSLWARVLAREVNEPGSHSRRTVNELADFDKRDCEMFTKLCRFCWWVDGAGLIPLIFDPKHPIYTEHGVTFGLLRPAKITTRTGSVTRRWPTKTARDAVMRSRYHA